jgi:hypothetical protein
MFSLIEMVKMVLKKMTDQLGFYCFISVWFCVVNFYSIQKWFRMDETTIRTGSFLLFIIIFLFLRYL